MPLTGIDGKSWNFYNAATGKWEQVWMNGGSVLKLEGQRNGEALTYNGVTSQAGGSSVRQRLTLTPMAGGKVHQFWEQSRDEGHTWTVAFDGIYLPREQKETPISEHDRRELLDHLKRSQEKFAKAIHGVSAGSSSLQSSPGPLVYPGVRGASGTGGTTSIRRSDGRFEASDGQ